MECTADFHDQVSGTFLEESDLVLDHTASLHTGINMLDAHSSARYLLVLQLLLLGQLFAPWLFGGHDDLNAIEYKTDKAQILQEFAARRKWIGVFIGYFLIVPLPLTGGAKKENFAVLINKQEVLYCVAFFLAAIEFFLCTRILGTLDASLTSVMTKRGVALT